MNSAFPKPVFRKKQYFAKNSQVFKAGQKKQKKKQEN